MINNAQGQIPHSDDCHCKSCEKWSSCQLRYLGIPAVEIALLFCPSLFFSISAFVFIFRFFSPTATFLYFVIHMGTLPSTAEITVCLVNRRGFCNYILYLWVYLEFLGIATYSVLGLWDFAFSIFKLYSAGPWRNIWPYSQLIPLKTEIIDLFPSHAAVIIKSSSYQNCEKQEIIRAQIVYISLPEWDVIPLSSRVPCIVRNSYFEIVMLMLQYYSSAVLSNCQTLAALANASLFSIWRWYVYGITPLWLQTHFLFPMKCKICCSCFPF